MNFSAAEANVAYAESLAAGDSFVTLTHGGNRAGAELLSQGIRLKLLCARRFMPTTGNFATRWRGNSKRNTGNRHVQGGHSCPLH